MIINLEDLFFAIMMGSISAFILGALALYLGYLAFKITNKIRKK